MCSEVTVKVWGIHLVSPEEENARLSQMLPLLRPNLNHVARTFS